MNPKIPDSSEGAQIQAQILASLWRIPWKKGLMWLSFGLLLYFLQDFFTLIMLTFVLSYIGNTLVKRGMAYTRHRRSITAAVFLLFLLAVLGAVWVPMGPIVKQGKRLIDKARALVPPKTEPGAEPTGTPTPLGKGFMDRLVEEVFGSRAGTVKEWLAIPVVKEHADEYIVEGAQTLARATGGLLAGTWFGVVNLLIALILSFLIVWDIPKIQEGLEGLSASRIGDFYKEVSPGVVAFGGLLGRTLQAQTVIALVNTALTAVGLALLGIQGVGFLCLIVFVCSFVPILGFITSTIPMLLVSFDQGGISLCIWVVVMVAVVHAVEGYVLNPQIYGASMNLHPLAVLIVLITFKQFFGIWGLVLGVPIAVYVNHHLIRGAEWHDSPVDEKRGERSEGREA